MRPVRWLLLTGVLIVSSHGQEYSLSKDGVGPFIMETRVRMDAKLAVFTGTARNQSGKPIRHAAWCVQAKRLKTGCSFILWTTQTPWRPGEEIKFEYTAPAGHGFPKHTVSLINLELVTIFDSIQKIYVESFQGKSGNLIREQLIALISNSGRFQVVSERGNADATLTGIAEPRGEETKVVSSSASSGASVGVVNAAVVASGVSAGSTRNANATGSLQRLSANTASGTSVTDSLILVSDTVVLRLTLPKGEIVWAWDDTRACHQSRTKCAVEDLLTAAR
jgi:hypothetical protein